MTATATVLPYGANAFLSEGTVIRFKGKKYRIEKANRVNYRISDESGATFNLNRHANVEVLEGETFTATPSVTAKSSTRDFHNGQRVNFVGTGTLAGRSGLVFQVNSATCGVVFEGIGTYRVPPHMIQAV